MGRWASTLIGYHRPTSSWSAVVLIETWAALYIRARAQTRAQQADGGTLAAFSFKAAEADILNY